MININTELGTDDIRKVTDKDNKQCKFMDRGKFIGLRDSCINVKGCRSVDVKSIFYYMI